MCLKSVYGQTCIHHYITIQSSFCSLYFFSAFNTNPWCSNPQVFTDVCTVYSFAFSQSALQLTSCCYVVVYCSLMTACFGGSSISFSDLKTNLFKLLNNIPLYGLILRLSIDQLKDTSIASNLYQLWEKPCYKYLYAVFFLGIHFHLIFVDSK